MAMPLRLRIRLLLVVLFVLVGFCNQIYAGAWVQRKSGAYFKLSVNYLFATKEFNHLGERLDIFQERVVYRDASFRDLNVTAYLEYGVFERLTVVANLQAKALTSERTEIIGGGAASRRVVVTTSGLSDLTLSFRYALWQSSEVVSVQAGIKLPLGYDRAPADDGPPLGTAHVDLEGFLLLGKSFHPVPVYASAGIGYRRRTGALHDQVLYSAEAGVSSGRFLFRVAVDGLQSTVTPPDIVGQPVVTPLPGGGGALPNIIVGDQNILKLSPAISYRLGPGLAVQGEVLHILAGKNTVAGSIFSLGVVLTR